MRTGRTARGVDRPLVGVIMGSRSDWETMRHASEALEALGVAHECVVVSAHRTPDWLFEYAESAASRGLRVIVAGAGGAAHLPGMCASKTALPVLGVPVESRALEGLDSLLSIVQMPAGVPVGTLAIGKAGATNAGLLAAAIVASGTDAIAERVRERVKELRAARTNAVMEDRDPIGDSDAGRGVGSSGGRAARKMSARESRRTKKRTGSESRGTKSRGAGSRR